MSQSIHSISFHAWKLLQKESEMRDEWNETCGIYHTDTHVTTCTINANHIFWHQMVYTKPVSLLFVFGGAYVRVSVYWEWMRPNVKRHFYQYLKHILWMNLCHFLSKERTFLASVVFSVYIHKYFMIFFCSSKRPFVERKSFSTIVWKLYWKHNRNISSFLAIPFGRASVYFEIAKRDCSGNLCSSCSVFFVVFGTIETSSFCQLHDESTQLLGLYRFIESKNNNGKKVFSSQRRKRNLRVAVK